MRLFTHKSVVGLMLTHTTLQLEHLQKQKHIFTSLKTHTIDLTESDALTTILSRWLSQQSISKAVVIVYLPDYQIFRNQIRLPMGLDDKAIQQQIKQDIIRELPQLIEEYWLDYRVENQIDFVQVHYRVARARQLKRLMTDLEMLKLKVHKITGKNETLDFNLLPWRKRKEYFYHVITITLVSVMLTVLLIGFAISYFYLARAIATVNWTVVNLQHKLVSTPGEVPAQSDSLKKLNYLLTTLIQQQGKICLESLQCEGEEVRIQGNAPSVNEIQAWQDMQFVLKELTPSKNQVHFRLAKGG